MPEDLVQILSSNRVSAQTRAVLHERARAASVEYRFFDLQEQAMMQRLEEAILPQAATGTSIRLSRYVDARLAAGQNMGWRYDVLPPDPEAYRSALRALAQELEAGENVDFLELLRRIENKELDTPGLAMSRWLEGIKVDLTRFWLAHPETMAVMRYDGFADDLLTADVPPVAAI